MATVDPTRSSAFRAASRALDAAIEAIIDGEVGRASGTTFVPADLARAGRLKAYARLGPVSIVDAEGNETRLPQDRTREMVAVAVIVGVVVWIAVRGPRSLA